MKILNRRFGGLIFVLFLAGCETRAGNTAVPPSPMDTLPPAAAVFPTVAPTASDTLTPTPSPTRLPTASPSPTPSATTLPSATSAQEPTASLGIIVIPSGTPASSSGACKNVLYPLGAGRRWKYQLTHQGKKSTALVSVAAVEGNAATVDLLDQTSGAHSSFTVNCAGDALSGFSTAEIGFLFFASVTSLQARTTSGLLAPSERDFSAGNWDYSWTTGMLATGQMVMSNSSMGEIDMVFRDAPVQIKWQTAGAGPQAFESVTAPAGTFSEALKVTAKARFDLMIELNLAGEDQLVPAVLELTSSLWYAPHVGLIKQIFASAEVFVGGYSCPVDISSQMELLEYTFPS